jgi:signal transduction histidine kinase
MRGRNSLRSRILFAFVITGAVLGPLLATALLWLTYELEERAVAKIASTRLEEVIARPDDFALKEAAPGVRVLSNFSTSAFPAVMFSLPDGVHEYETDKDAWFVALRTTASGRYAVVEDITALERRERLTLLTVAAGTVLAILLAWGLGAHLSRRLVAPLEELTERVAGADPLDDPAPQAQRFPDREVATLAAALDVYASRMRQALQREREFSADVSHELRNPLAVMQNAGELIEDDPSASDLTRRAAGRIREAAQHMTDTVTVLLTLVRERRAPLPEEGVSVAECLQALRERLPSTPADGPQLQWHSRAEPMVRAPRAVVEAVAGNLIRNAQEHSVGRRIEVRLEDDRLVVEDDGVGIAPEELTRIEARDARGARESNPGRGVGLSLVQRLCVRFDWALHIESRPGEGTRVEWRFGAV